MHVCVCASIFFGGSVEAECHAHLNRSTVGLSESIVTQQCGHSTNASVSAEILFASLRRSVPFDGMFIVWQEFGVSHKIC